jgi:hypothetical protein
LAVKVALGEASVLAETKRWLAKEGIRATAFEAQGAELEQGTLTEEKRSTDTLVVKHLPATASGKASGPKLKPLVWQKVPKNRLKGTVWNDIKEGEAPEFNMERFEMLFTSKPPPKPANLTRAGSSVANMIAVSLLDPKRANNLSIILTRLRKPFDEIRRAVVDLDAEVLSHEAVGALQKCVPSPEEVELVQAADSASLGYAEKFVLALGTVPRLKARLDCFAFKHRFNQQLHALYADTSILTAAASQLVDCSDLSALLGMLLRLGNALNAGSFRAGAEGFKLECLTRLAELKANAEQSSLLQFALESMHSADGSSSVASFSSELPAVRDAAKLSTSELLEEVARLEAGIKLVGGELAHYNGIRDKAPDESDSAACDRHVACERFVQVMQPFYDGALPQLEELTRATSAMGEAQGKMKTFFSEESKASVDEAYSRWASFLNQLDQAAANINDDRRKAEARKAK